VTWSNHDIVPHTATAQGKFDSGNIAPGKSFSRKLEQPGEFDYICTYHPGMKGKVTVK
jgi:plastocyanin